MRGQGRFPKKGQAKSEQQAHAQTRLSHNTNLSPTLRPFALSVLAYNSRNFTIFRHSHQCGDLALRSFISAITEPYQLTRLDMNGTATMNMDRTVTDIDEASKSAMALMALPRELRDLIYEDLVGTKYHLDTYQILNGVPHFSEPPTLSEPSSGSDSNAMFRYDPAIGNYRRVPFKVFRHQSGEVLYKYPFPPRPSLSILQTSIRVREEALHVLYQKGTLLFVLNHPSHDSFLSTKSHELITHFNNIEIFLDLVSIFNDSLSPSDEIRAIKLTMELIERHGDSVPAASTCTLSTYYRYDRDIFETYFFNRLLHAAGKLCVFKKVVLRFGNKYRRTENFLFSSTKLAAERFSTDEWAIHTYKRLLRSDKSSCLGPCEESYDSEGFYCMVFHPRDQSGGGGSSNSGMD